MRLAPEPSGISVERFAALEVTIERGWHAFVEVGHSLLEIRASGAYREHAGFASFEAYLRARWGISRPRGYQLMQAAEIMGELSTNVDTAALPPLREWHLRQLAQLPTEERRAVAEQLALGELSPRRLQHLARRKRDTQPRLTVVSPPTPTTRLPEQVVIQHADAAALPWADGAADLWVTSPPYCLGIEEAGYVDYTDYPAYIGSLARSWATELYRVAAPWGRLCLNVPLDITRPREPLAADWVQVLRSVGWTYRTVILWQEGNISRGTARGSVDSPGAPNVICPTEVVLVFHKGSWNLAPARRQRPEWGPPDLTRQEWLDWTMANWSFAGEQAGRVGGYPAAFPEELARRCIKLFSFPRAVVGDPFGGSGTTPLVAARLGRRRMTPGRRLHPTDTELELLQPWARRAFEDACRRPRGSKPRAKMSPTASSPRCVGHTSVRLCARVVAGRRP